MLVLGGCTLVTLKPTWKQRHSPKTNMMVFNHWGRQNQMIKPIVFNMFVLIHGYLQNWRHQFFDLEVNISSKTYMDQLVVEPSKWESSPKWGGENRQILKASPPSGHTWKDCLQNNQALSRGVQVRNPPHYSN